MDWSNVTTEELVLALRQVEWNSTPRPVSEFFSKFTPPKNQSKLVSRLKCNVYYFRMNYVLIALLCFLGAFCRNPLAIVGLINAGLAAMLLNDSFARSFSEKIMKGVRQLSPRLAQKMRAASAGGGSTLGSGPADRSVAKQDVKIAGASRMAVVGLLGLTSLVVIYVTSAVMTLALGVLLSTSLVGAHASFRSPNLKARLASAREEFRAVWRGYGEFSHDYTL